MKYLKVIADQFEPTGYDWKLQYNPSHGATVRAPILFTTVKAIVIGMFQIQNVSRPPSYYYNWHDLKIIIYYSGELLMVGKQKGLEAGWS
jgi:hypothetical protein